MVIYFQNNRSCTTYGWIYLCLSYHFARTAFLQKPSNSCYHPEVWRKRCQILRSRGGKLFCRKGEGGKTVNSWKFSILLLLSQKKYILKTKEQLHPQKNYILKKITSSKQRSNYILKRITSSKKLHPQNKGAPFCLCAKSFFFGVLFFFSQVVILPSSFPPHDLKKWCLKKNGDVTCDLPVVLVPASVIGVALLMTH